MLRSNIWTRSRRPWPQNSRCTNASDPAFPRRRRSGACPLSREVVYRNIISECLVTRRNCARVWIQGNGRPAVTCGGSSCRRQELLIAIPPLLYCLRWSDELEHSSHNLFVVVWCHGIRQEVYARHESVASLMSTSSERVGIYEL